MGNVQRSRTNRNQLALFSSQTQSEPKVGSLRIGRESKHRSIVWVSPELLVDHYLNNELFGAERSSDIDELAISMRAGYDVHRPIKAVKRADGTVVIIDGHRRKRAAIAIKIKVPVIVQSFKSETEEREEMILCNLVRNRSYKSFGIGTAVRLIQLLQPSSVKRGRPSKKNMAPRASISNNASRSKSIEQADYQEADEGQEDVNSGLTRRAYYARLLGIKEKTFRMADYVLRNGTDDEKRELDTGPRKLTAVYNGVLSRRIGEKRVADDPREIARAARVALRATKSLFVILNKLDQNSEEEIETDLKLLARLAKNEIAGTVSRNSTATRACELLRELLASGLR